MVMGFRDYFSVQASDYAKHRPTYPAELFDFLAGLVKHTSWAWDCATGNGQAALGLARHFQKVTATDATEKQIAQAFPHPRVEYAVAPAERSGLPDHRLDLVTVAQALHWFDHDGFFNEARRVLKPEGLLAAWAYGHFKTEKSVNDILERFGRVTLKSYWPPENDLVFNDYRDLYFPVHEIKAPKFEMKLDWNLDEVCGYLLSWSATQKFISIEKQNPIETLKQELALRWGEPSEKKPFAWTITMRAGRFSA